jgi:hypothetical protein
MARADSERFDTLEEAGFNVERYGDLMHVLFERLGGHYMDVGTSAKISQGLVRLFTLTLPPWQCKQSLSLYVFSSHLTEVQIKVKSGGRLSHYTPDGLAFEDGTELKADVIVFTTGFVQNMRQIAGRIVGPEVEDQLDDFWGIDAEGEIRGAFKPAGRKYSPTYNTVHVFAGGSCAEKKESSLTSPPFLADPGVWFTGGDIGIARYYGRFIALQIKAQLMGAPLQVYEG